MSCRCTAISAIRNTQNIIVGRHGGVTDITLTSFQALSDLSDKHLFFSTAVWAIICLTDSVRKQDHRPKMESFMLILTPSNQDLIFDLIMVLAFPEMKS